jgi:hypothetical protein
MVVALTFPILIGLFLVAMERWEARVFGPYPDAAPAVAGPAGNGTTPSAEPVLGAGNGGDDIDIGPKGADRGIEGRGAWTYR